MNQVFANVDVAMCFQFNVDHLNGNGWGIFLIDFYHYTTEQIFKQFLFLFIFQSQY